MSSQIGNSFDEYWRAYLAGARPTALSFSSRPAVDQDVGTAGTRSRTNTGRIENAVFDSIIVAAWALVVARYSLEDDIVFGLSLPSQDDIADDATPTYPYRIRAPETETTTSAFLESVQSTLHQCLSHRDKPSDRIPHLDSCCKEACERSTHLQIASNPGLSDSFKSAEPYPISIKCTRGDRSIECWIEFDIAFCTAHVAHALLDHFTSAIPALSSASMAVGELDLFGTSDFVSVVERWTQAPEPVSAEPFLHHAVERQARSNPLAVAVGQTDCAMSYGELDKGATLLAEHLIATAPRRSDEGIGNVAILFEKSPFAILAMLAILKAGGAFVPLDIDWPERRTQMVLAGADIQVVLCSSAQQARLKSLSVQTISVTQQLVYDLKKRPAPSPQDSRGQKTALQSSAPAYIVFTSGSTGTPKGIEISHRSITTSLQAMSREFNVQKSSRLLQSSAFTFDVSVGDIWLALSNGARLCLPSEDERFALDPFIAAERCNFALMTPSLAATIDPSVTKKHLKRTYLIGESPSPALLRRLAAPCIDNVLSNTWGPTEACVICTASAPIQAKAAGTLSPSPRNIGKCFGCTVFIVSAENPNHLAPAYAPGEIALVGHTLATSYYGDAEKTDAAFRTDLAWARDPRLIERFGNDVMGRVYLTGDIGRFSEEGDGTIVFMHRRGGYIKVNGFRIDPGEVEKAICDLASNGEDAQTGSVGSNIAVLAFERPVVDERASQTRQTLACFFATGSRAAGRGAHCELREMDMETRSSVARLATELRAAIPEYMVPELFVPVTCMPVSTSSKLDQKALTGLLEPMDWKRVVEKYGAHSVADEGSKS